MDDGPLVSVVMPTFGQAHFIMRAFRSLMAQTMPRWELIVVDDGSRDGTQFVLNKIRDNRRVSIIRLNRNSGLGAAANAGLDMSGADLIAYLPSDDLFYPTHLETLKAALNDPSLSLAYTGMSHEGKSRVDPDGLQLVQVMHRRTRERWVERSEFESDDLNELFFDRLLHDGEFAGINRVTCAWMSHPAQRHKVMRPAHDGGLNTFRRRYDVAEPLRFRARGSPSVDEAALYAPFRKFRRRKGDGLKILLVGELSFHPERIVALEDRGHELFGLWIDDPLGPQTVGPLPFGNVVDLAPQTWRREIKRIRPDVIYALLGWRAIPLAHDVLMARTGIPLVWHFKEAPMRAMNRGTFPQLVDLCLRADARIYSTELEREWFDAVLPERTDAQRTLVIDGDLPSRQWFADRRSDLVSESDGDIHTVCVGRPKGIDEDIVMALAQNHMHLHLYGLVDSPGGSAAACARDLKGAAPDHVHIHAAVDQRFWTAEFSRYDAGWLHCFRSENGGEVRHATWEDMNRPARLGTLAAAGVPFLQRASPRCAVETERLIERDGNGVVFEDTEDLISALKDRDALAAVRRRAWAARHRWTFDHYVDDLVSVFTEVTT